ncbi:hypothetical protein [Paenibacillus thalictri]|uniref:DUF455 family protein n=1 Tax=Paenibacillus thalictri TaxID=2527873 RepID=A0A4Q9DW23_9BACL|nr:hypothetical protein [Paenibacillus thalictri]TBL80586.1 hypothetical protein EYB31_04985 [Paenibacillus thalictri]
MHPFMGIEHWDRIGLSVEESSRRLRRIGFVDRQLMRIEVGHMLARPEYEIKGALARLAWQEAKHNEELRNRCKQLRLSSVAYDKCPDAGLQLLMDRTLESESTLLLLTALFKVVKPAQIAACRAYMELAQPLVDEPTISLLKHQLIDREDQIGWGLSAIGELATAASSEELQLAARWETYLTDLLEACGGIEGQSAARTPDPLLAVPSKAFALPERSTRDERFTSSVVKFKDIEFADSDQGRFELMMYSRYFEMTPAEGIAYVHFTTEGKPWAFYFDTARHLWDEVRHSWFGEAALRVKGYDVYSKPNWTGWYEMAQYAFDNDETYTHLTIAIEKAAMKYPPGKREEWEFCRDIVKDPLMTTFQDFDWADEVVHAGFGQKWIIDALHSGDSAKAMAAAEATVCKRVEFMKQYENGTPTKGTPFAGNY